jgi:hypothetical protein
MKLVAGVEKESDRMGAKHAISPASPPLPPLHGKSGSGFFSKKN